MRNDSREKDNGDSTFIQIAAITYTVSGIENAKEEYATAARKGYETKNGKCPCYAD